MSPEVQSLLIFLLTAISYHWQFGDGATSTEPAVTRTYNTPGRHSEVLKVVDAQGNVSYDFAVVIRETVLDLKVIWLTSGELAM